MRLMVWGGLFLVLLSPLAWAQQQRQEEPLEKQLARCRGQLVAANSAANGSIGGCMQSGGDISVLMQEQHLENAQLRARVKDLEEQLKKLKEQLLPLPVPTAPEG